MEERSSAFSPSHSPLTWDADSFPWSEATVDAEVYMASDEGVAEALKSILVNGFAVVRTGGFDAGLILAYFC